MKYKTLIAALFISIPVFAGSIKVWSTGEVLTSGDLNDNFSHVHTALRGGSHTAILDADISGSAAITHSKLASPTLVPKAWAYVGGPCAISTTCTQAVSGGAAMTIAGLASAGAYTATWTSARADGFYAPIITPVLTSTTYSVTCHIYALTAASFSFICQLQDGTPAGEPVGFTLVVLDNL